jgi:DNA invertase Pin-like site-specific DNA recombinase
MDASRKGHPVESERPLLIGLVRVSTEKQAASGLGLEGQHAAIERYRSDTKGDLIETYTEVESGKHNDIQRRPKLREAAEHALEVNGTLVIAKLDRLVRSASVLQYLRDSGVKFVACDNPYANKLTVHILVGVAEHEAEMISLRTKAALEAYRVGKHVSKRMRELHPDGVPAGIAAETAGKLGAHLPQCRNLDPTARAKGRLASIAARKAKALKSAAAIGRIIATIRAENPAISLEQIAVRLNARRRKTPRGGEWTGRQVKRALDRLQGKDKVT